jgi:hypothetical protein
MNSAPGDARRPLFVATVLTGSFLLFAIQPMVARLEPPRLVHLARVQELPTAFHQIVRIVCHFCSPKKRLLSWPVQCP